MAIIPFFSLIPPSILLHVNVWFTFLMIHDWWFKNYTLKNEWGYIQHNRVVEPKMNSHQIIFIQFSNNEGSKSQQFLGGGWRHLNDHVWKRSPGHDTNDVIMGGFDAHSSTYLVVVEMRLPVPPLIMVSTLLSLSLSHFKNHKNCSCCDHLTRFFLWKIISFQVIV